MTHPTGSPTDIKNKIQKYQKDKVMLTRTSKHYLRIPKRKKFA
jgi:hypothetical protein